MKEDKRYGYKLIHTERHVQDSGAPLVLKDSYLGYTYGRPNHGSLTEYVTLWKIGEWNSPARKRTGLRGEPLELNSFDLHCLCTPYVLHYCRSLFYALLLARVGGYFVHSEILCKVEVGGTLIYDRKQHKAGATKMRVVEAFPLAEKNTYPVLCDVLNTIERQCALSSSDEPFSLRQQTREYNDYVRGIGREDLISAVI